MTNAYCKWISSIAAASLLLGGCSGNASNALVPSRDAMRLTQLRPAASGKIQHVVIVMQENRSFDNLFQGYPGADTQSYGYASDGSRIDLQQIGLETSWDIDHSSGSFFQACNGTGTIPGTRCRMNGFDQEWVGCSYSCPQHAQYAYVPPSESKPYFTIASQYVLADRMFASNFDASSFISHQYIIAGQAGSAVDYPSGMWGCDGGNADTVWLIDKQRQTTRTHPACFDYRTLADEIDAAGLSWRFYTASLYGDGNIWSAFQVVKHIRYGTDWSNVVTPQTKLFEDVRHGRLPNVSWVTPTCENSDHAGCGSNTGPAWVSAIVNTIGKSQYWDSTAIFIMWDDYGGWYDHVPPPWAGYDGLGMRVPLLVVSPYAKRGYVSHVQYEHGSILKFVEDQFGLGRLTATDTRANSPETDCFNFSQAPRAFVPIPTKLQSSDFERRPLDRRPPDTQ